MEKKVSSTNKGVTSRNRNKNKNKNLQIKAREREIAKKEKNKKVVEDIESVLKSDEVEVKAIIVDTPLRDNVVVVPDRKVVVEDDDNDPNFISVDIDRFRFTESDDEDFLDRFKFDEEDEPKVGKTQEEELEEFINYENIEEVPYEETPQLDREEIETVSVDEEIIPRTTDKVDINAKKYFSFESRIMLLLIVIIVSFFIAGFFIFKAVTYSSNDAIIYDEKGTLDYEVCITDANNQYYSDNCLDSDMEYLSDITERVPVTFDYDMVFNNSVSTKVSYYVVSKINIYREKQGKVLNTMEEVLVERTEHEVFGDETGFAIDVDLPFKKYKEYVNSYNSQYNVNSYAELEVIFYVDNGNVIKKASAMTLPISTQTFSVDVFEIDNTKQNLTLDSHSWAGINTSYGAVGIIFVLFGVLGIIRLSSLVFKVMGTTSMYQRKLNKILREYDKYIVISRGDYEVDNSKRLIKVASFGELLDARNTLEKPIVYVKVNNVKSEFYVEDSESIYKYTLKEADCEGK